MQLKRLYEFVDYHIHGDGECNGMVLKAWADSHSLSWDDRVDLCYFFAVTYCVESAIVLLKSKPQVFDNGWAKENKNKIIFQSDRKYIKMRNCFEICLAFLKNNREEAHSIEDVIDLSEWIPRVEKWPQFGRFSAYLFLETCAWVLGCDIVNAEMDWEHGDTATSGLMNLYGYDNAANAFDATRRLRKPFTQENMQQMVEPVLSAVESAGGSKNITMVETSLCAYRKFFKGSRYNGYYLDRMLEEIYSMKKDFPDISKELIDIRMRLFDSKYLGELGGWKGIRKECKKLYKETGIIM